MSISRRPPPPSPDRLERLKLDLRAARDLTLRIRDLEGQLKEAEEELLALQATTLPDLFKEAQIKEWVLESEGNSPRIRARLSPYYKASIAADWEPGRRAEAFQALTEAGGGDMIRTQFIVNLPPGSAMVERIEKGLKALKVDYERQQAVHWRTLTSFIQEQYEADPPRALPLEKLGAVVGLRVTIKPEKEKIV